MQELNLAYKYGTIYWKTSCLTVNAGLIGDKEGNANYGAISKAIGDMRGLVLNPDINRSELGFTPLKNENKILFGLKSISGLGKDAIKIIMERRPFSSFEDFIKKCVLIENEGEEKIERISEAKVVTLIKAGCFDNLEKMKRRELMAEFVKIIAPKKEQLTMQNIQRVIHKAPVNLSNEVEAYKLRNKLFGRGKIKMNPELEREFMDFNSLYPGTEYTFEEGRLVIDQKSFDKVYKQVVEPLRQWVTSREAADIFNKLAMQEIWIKHCMGSVEQWEMETVGFYSNRHELDYMPLKNYFNISNFFEVKSNDFVKRGKYTIFNLHVIAGTVVDKDKDKRIVYLSTQYGVVTVKYSKGAFLHYDKKVVEVKGEKKTVLDNSWFDRGTKLVIVGYRRDDEFIPKVYKNSRYPHTTMKIKTFTKDEIQFQMEKIKVE